MRPLICVLTNLQEIGLVLSEGIVHLTQMDICLVEWLAKVCFTLIPALLLMLVITYD